MTRLKSRKIRHSLSAAQLQCLASDRLRAIVEVLAEGPPLARREIASRLGQPPTSLHYQLRKLIKFGLVVEAGERTTVRRPERLYGLVAGELSSESVSATDEGRMALAKAGARVAKSAARSFERLARQQNVSLAGPTRRAAVRRVVVNLDDEGLAALNRLIDHFSTEGLADLSTGAQRIVLTVIVA